MTLVMEYGRSLLPLSKKTRKTLTRTLSNNKSLLKKKKDIIIVLNSRCRTNETSEFDLQNSGENSFSN